MTTIDIVCTTIGNGSFLKPYAEEITSAGAQHRARIIVISDHKTDHQALNIAVTAARDAGIVVECPSLREQVQFLESMGEPDMFPWNSNGRRNIGYLMAWRDGTDVMISVDDDNLPTPGWLTEHETVAYPSAQTMVSSSTGFWNPCTLLGMWTHYFWPRGFPYTHRWEYPILTQDHRTCCDVAINEGLWLGDPDVDAITRLAMRPVTTSVAAEGSRVLAKGTWAPLNTQNTAIRREVIPAYRCFENAKRFDDIWQGYFAQACAQHLGHHVRFGTPAADCEVRNDHDLLNDLALEYDGIMILDKMLEWLTGLKLSGSTYAEAYECLSHELDAHVQKVYNPSGPAMALFGIPARMRQWLKVLERLS